ncbi:hypothetical protein niasHS_011851 [Heterodera schachtii]|uniref:BTB domain-containing protein n=1 Tax=Heterodera schachtii TaxID=97005 RepID=A0ABD2IRB2_HETSC
MKYTFYYFVIFSIFANLHVKALPPKDKAGTSNGQIVTSLADQMKEVLDNGEYSDVQFLVGKGDKKEATHRAILSSASDVFKAMFRYDKGQIEITDIEIDTFKTMLTFIYTKHSNGLNANNWLDVLKAADKYNIKGLVNECANFPVEKLTNVFVAIEKALLLNMEDFTLRCLRYIDQNARKLFNTVAFLQIHQDLLCVILERDQLRSSEIEIWNAALRWADEQCSKNSIECSAEKRRKMLGPALFNIRFTLMRKEEFTKSIVSTDVLTTEEVDSIDQHYSNPKLSDLPGLIKLKFPTHQRYKYEDTIEMEIEKVSEFVLEEELLDPSKGFYNKDEDKVKLAIDFIVDEPEEKFVSDPNKSNGTLSMEIEKISEFAREIIESLYNKEEDKVTLTIDVIMDEPKTAKIISDPNKSNGTLSMQIEKLSEFVREINLSERKSETVTYVKGMPWKILAQIKTENESTDNEKWLGFSLLCYVSEEEALNKVKNTFEVI